jgi:hypothetical protein
VNGRQAQVFLAGLTFLLMSLGADVIAAETYRLAFTDVDGNSFSTADGHVTTVVLTTQAGVDKARLVGDRIPDFCLGNTTYRMITVLVFEKKHSKPTQVILRALMRRRLDAEGHRLQTRYDNLKIAQAARPNVSAVADFDGMIANQLGCQPAADLFRVFVLGKNGELINEWTDVPSAEELSFALKRD